MNPNLSKVNRAPGGDIRHDREVPMDAVCATLNHQVACVVAAALLRVGRTAGADQPTSPLCLNPSEHKTPYRTFPRGRIVDGSRALTPGDRRRRPMSGRPANAPPGDLHRGNRRRDGHLRGIDSNARTSPATDRSCDRPDRDGSPPEGPGRRRGAARGPGTDGPAAVVWNGRRNRPPAGTPTAQTLRGGSVPPCWVFRASSIRSMSSSLKRRRPGTWNDGPGTSPRSMR